MSLETRRHSRYGTFAPHTSSVYTVCTHTHCLGRVVCLNTTHDFIQIGFVYQRDDGIEFIYMFVSLIFNPRIPATPVSLEPSHPSHTFNPQIQTEIKRDVCKPGHAHHTVTRSYSIHKERSERRKYTGSYFSLKQTSITMKIQ